MYDLPFDDPTRAGWILAGVVAVLLIVRAVRSQYRSPRQAARRLDVGIDALCTLAVLALVVLLVAIPVTTLA